MLKNIKSTYFIKIIFKYIDEKHKLKLVKCNKDFQKNIDININNYKYFSGRYIIYETNGIAKEYYGENDALIFEGEYLNGKRNGKGKEYDIYGNLIFEGEYLNGKKNGKGKEYFHGCLILDGEYLNGKRNGKGKYYDCNGKLLFEGEYLNDKQWIGTRYDKNGNIIYKLTNNINGKGKEYYNIDGKLLFEGEYLKGIRNGKGKAYHFNGKLRFEGEYLNGLKWNGKGYAPFDTNIEYVLKDGKGYVKNFYDHNDYFYFEGNIKLGFEGEYLYGKKNGKGKEYDFDGSIFEGEYLNGKRNGKGREYYPNGKLRFEGEYLYNKKLKGKLYIEDHLEYEGEYLYNKKYNGKGYDKNGNIIYELINGNGKVKEYHYNGKLEFEGEYLNGKRNGKGKEYDEDGQLEFEGNYLNGEKISKK